MKDPYQQMLEDAIAISLFMVCLAVAIFTQGCTRVDKVVDISMDKNPTQECPKLVMPPIPDDVLLDIKGDSVTANAGGDLLLRGYSRARTLLKPDAPAR